MSPRLAYDLAANEWSAALEGWGEPAYRARQVWAQVYRRLAAGPESMSDLPPALRARLAETFDFAGLSPHRRLQSRDGSTEKILFRLSDGKEIETVLMRYAQRRTVCLSTQAGCGMGCTFCATGQMGWQRNLSGGEIVAQVLFFARQLSAQGERLTNLVVMGMGEPFHNYDSTMQALDRLNEPDGFAFGARRMTVSTVGLVPMIERFTDERRQVNLAVSLHAATDELRSQLVPVNQRYPLAALRAACLRYSEVSRRRLSLEWALIEDVNDGSDQAEALAGWAEGLTCHVNVIPLNPTGGYDGRAASRQRVAAFREHLLRRGIPCSVRVRRGLDIQAGCGQLATEAVAAVVL